MLNISLDNGKTFFTVTRDMYWKNWAKILVCLYDGQWSGNVMNIICDELGVPARDFRSYIDTLILVKKNYRQYIIGQIKNVFLTRFNGRGIFDFASVTPYDCSIIPSFFENEVEEEIKEKRDREIRRKFADEIKEKIEKWQRFKKWEEIDNTFASASQRTPGINLKCMAITPIAYYNC